MDIPRSAGILLHPTSLPSGRLGDEAYAFVDWLSAAGIGWWQMLPLTPPDSTGSMYFSDSAFAAWTGLLAEPEAPVADDEIEAFRAREAYWIGDWERFCAELRPGGSTRAARAAAAREAVAGQVRFEREWTDLRAYARERGVRLIGDVPIYIAPGSADHLAHPELFQPHGVAGCPPDALGPDGQHWGNPLYDWQANLAEGFRWWTERFRRAFALVDLVRIDHFRGFVAYWNVPDGAPTAAYGFWRPGPGRLLFDAVAAGLRAGPGAGAAPGAGLPLIAEDLGIITPRVFEVRDALGYPGMAVLQFAFDDDPANPHTLENHREQLVVYTGTHDTNTAVGWWKDEIDAATRRRSRLNPRNPAWSLIELACSSRAALAVVPLQDVLRLGGEHRMNMPGTVGGTNWQWRMAPGALTPALARRLRAEVEKSGRLSSTGDEPRTDRGRPATPQARGTARASARRSRPS